MFILHIFNMKRKSQTPIAIVLLVFVVLIAMTAALTMFVLKASKFNESFSVSFLSERTMNIRMMVDDYISNGYSWMEATEMARKSVDSTRESVGIDFSNNDAFVIIQTSISYGSKTDRLIYKYIPSGGSPSTPSNPTTPNLDEVEVQKCELKFKVYDNDFVDGDQIDLGIGGTMVLRDYILGAPVDATERTFTLTSQTTEVTVHADNEGDGLHPLNTGLFVVQGGGNRQIEWKIPQGSDKKFNIKVEGETCGGSSGSGSNSGGGSTPVVAARVCYTPGVGENLAFFGTDYTRINQYEELTNCDVYIMASSTGYYLSDDDRQRIKSFVEGGGYFFTTDSEYSNLALMFPDVFSESNKETVYLGGIMEVDVIDSEFKTKLGDKVNIRIDGSANSFKASTNFDTLIKTSSGSSVLMLRYRVGQGAVYFSAFKLSDQEQTVYRNILELIIAGK